MAMMMKFEIFWDGNEEEDHRTMSYRVKCMSNP